MSELTDRLRKRVAEAKLNVLRRSEIPYMGMVAEVDADEYTRFLHEAEEAADRIEFLEAELKAMWWHESPTEEDKG